MIAPPASAPARMILRGASTLLSAPARAKLTGASAVGSSQSTLTTRPGSMFPQRNAARKERASLCGRQTRSARL
jgi:hypothetical protein